MGFQRTRRPKRKLRPRPGRRAAATALLAEKQEQYAEYKALRQDMIAYRTAKQNVDKILGIMPEEQEQNRDQRPER